MTSGLQRLERSGKFTKRVHERHNGQLDHLLSYNLIWLAADDLQRAWGIVKHCAVCEMRHPKRCTDPTQCVLLPDRLK
jgi:hypothetical protein